MGVRPPTNDDEEPEAIEFGIAAVDARLDGADLEFPATDGEVAAAVGDAEVPYDANGNSLAISEALAAIDRERYESKVDLLDALHPVFEEHRVSSSGSLLRQVRSMMPF